MSLKIVKTAPTLAVSSGVTTSSGIELSSGYLRVVSSVACNVAIGTEPSASANDFYLPPNVPEILKERVARQRVVGVTTGTTTVIEFGSNNGNPFSVGDYVTVAGSVGVNTSHKRVLNSSLSSIVVDYNTSAVPSPTITDAYVFRSVKISAFSGGSGSLYISEVQIASQA